MDNDSKDGFSIDLGEFTLSEEISSASRVQELPNEVEFSMDLSQQEKAEVESPSKIHSTGLDISEDSPFSLSDAPSSPSSSMSDEEPLVSFADFQSADEASKSAEEIPTLDFVESPVVAPKKKQNEVSFDDFSDKTRAEPVAPVFKAPKAPPAPKPQPSAASVSSDFDMPSYDMPTFPASKAPTGEEADTLKKYATLKERELREKDSLIAVLRSQISQVESKLQKSETERRRVSHEYAEMQTLVKTLEEQNESHQFHTRKLEEQHKEEIRAIQLRFDNVQFQAAKAEKKLEEFRSKVKQDIVKIRERERELMNRLELAKRDAEALLKAKDERLMSQRREIDKLQFELESLKEKLLEDTQKAEDRAGRVGRALKSLRMVTGILSTIEEDVLPTAASGKGIKPTGNQGDDEAA